VETIGRYQVVRQLGHGAMGRVFLARDPSLERLVALKLLHAEASQRDVRARFHDEAKMLAALSHPGIVMIFEIGEHDGQDFIAMEYLAGRSLRELLQRPELGAQRVDLIAICAKVAVALGAAHTAGILHRDIKPENVVVMDGGDVKVVDFGISRRLNMAEPRRSYRRFETPIEQRVEELVEAFAITMPLTTPPRDTVITAGTQTVFGTPGYMAPEVLVGGESSASSDVYGLGVMLYECVAGRPPYEGRSLVEVMARAIDGSERPARLDDDLADLIERMLSRDPASRPPLDEVATALTPAARATPSPRARRWPAIVAVGLGLGAVGAWQLSRGQESTPAVVAPARVVPMSIAIEPIPLTTTSYGSHPPNATAIGGVVAVLVAEINGNEVVAPAELFGELKLPMATAEKAEPTPTVEVLSAAERKLGVHFAVRGRFDERADGLHARLEVVSLAGGGSRLIELARPMSESDKLMNDVAEEIARVGDPHANLDRASNRRRARALTDRGEASLAENKFYDARPYLEQAVNADPTFFDAWNALATTRAWMFAPDDDIIRAIDRARDLAPAGQVKQLLQGTSLYLHHDYPGALATLAPLETSTTLSERDRRALLYYLGEVKWHDGEQAEGVDFFHRALALDSRFMPAMIHPTQYALARRDAAEARHMIDLQRSVDYEPLEFALRHYDQIARSNSGWALHAQLVLGQPPSPKLEAKLSVTPIDWAAYRLARALDTGDATAASRAIDDVWKVVEAPGRGEVQPQEYYSLQVFGEVVICASMVEDTRRLVAFLANKAAAHPVGGYPRLALLAAALLRDGSWIVRTGLTTRDARLADAIEAELAGDHRRAAALLAALVADPTPNWDYPERAALLRNLRALGRWKEAKALCADTLRPAVFRYAFLPMKKLCR
jgi:predicted Ser/Thr protein kinase/tetratricopeptide (TPR) repeat protein